MTWQSRAPHPRYADRLRWLLVRFGPIAVTALFVLLLALSAALLALALALDAHDLGSFPRLWRDEGMLLLNLEIEAPKANTGSTAAQVVDIVQGLLGLLLPAIYISVLVFRLFIHPKVFVFRKKITVQPKPETFRRELGEDGHVLAIRVYNASPMRALEVHFRAIHQHWYGADRDAVVRNVPLELANPDWPMAERPVPYTLFVKLESDDVVATEDGGLRLATLRGSEISERDRLVIHVSGVMPNVGDAFTERHCFNLPEDLGDEPYGVVHLDYHAHPKSWGGWDGFDA